LGNGQAKKEFPKRGGIIMKTHASRQFQENIDQYKMPEALKTSKKGHYRVGYEATTGNNTDTGKKTED
jgi:hypothetical protein